MLSKNHPAIGKPDALIIYVTQYVTKATKWPAKKARNYSFKGL